MDRKRGFVGSANATNSGLNFISHGNMEMGTLVDIDEFDMNKIEALYKDAVFVDDSVYEKLKMQYRDVESSESGTTYAWNDEIRNLFNPRISTLFSHELPEKDKYVQGDVISFLETTYTGDEVALREAFRWSNAYLWLLNILKENNGCLYYGTITEKLHNALVSDPKPYRKDVKQLLSNLLTLVEELHMDEIVIDKPNYSQRVRLKEVC